MTNYITKNFRADLVVVHNLSDGLPPMGMWNEMQLHLDANTQLFAGLHRDSKSGIIHVHLLGNRIDMLGNINDAKFIGERAMKVAAIINRRRGWKDPMQIREEHIRQIAGDCMDILRQMPEFHWWTYEAELRKRGYEVKLNRDSMGEVRGYSIKMGNSSYKASELRKDRRLLASRLYRTWVLLHEQHEEPVTESRRSAQPQQNTKTPIIPVTSPQKKDEDDEEYRVKPKSPKTLEIVTSQPMKPAAQEMYHDSFSVDGKDYDLTIPMPAYQVMKDVLELSDTAAQTTNDVLHVAMLLFLDYADAATTMAESVGGGGSVESNWGRKKDDDDEEWARRCARKASWLCKPMCRTFKR